MYLQNFIENSFLFYYTSILKRVTIFNSIFIFSFKYTLGYIILLISAG